MKRLQLALGALDSGDVGVLLLGGGLILWGGLDAAFIVVGGLLVLQARPLRDWWSD